MDEEYIECFSCGAKSLNLEGGCHEYMLSSAGCFEMFNEVLNREYSDYRYSMAHHYTVDSYAVQHPGKVSNQKAVDSPPKQFFGPSVIKKNKKSFICFVMNQNPITRLLNNYSKKGNVTDDELYAVIYSELKKTASSVRRQWQGNLTMNATSLVHEAYLKMSHENVDWKNRLHFFYFAGKVMRQILYNFAEKKMALKRGGRNGEVDIEESKINIALDEKSFLEILCLENILESLEKHDDIYGKIIECRFYSGMTIEETAKVLNTSEATVKRKWRFARAWLYKEMQKAS